MPRLAKRVIDLDTEINETTAQLTALVNKTAPQLLEVFGVKTHTAAQLLVTAGDNPTRLTDQRSFALLTRVAPLLASSSRTDRHHAAASRLTFEKDCSREVPTPR